MQFVAPKKVHSRGLIRTRYKVVFLITGVLILFQYQKTSYDIVTKVAYSKIPDEVKKLLNRKNKYPYVAIWHTVNIIPQVAAGRLAEMFGAKWILFTAVLILGICLCTIPFAVGQIYNTILVDGITGIMALCHGSMIPAASVMLSRWAPPKERFAICSSVYCSILLGQAMAIFINTWLSNTLQWMYVFYFSAIIYILWLILWVHAAHDDPSEQGDITEEERQFLYASLKDELYENNRRIESVAPWKKILISPNIWAIVLIHVTVNLYRVSYKVQFGADTKHFDMNNKMHPLNRAVILTAPYVWTPVITILLGLVFFNLAQNGVRKVQLYRFGILVSLIGGLLHVVFRIFKAQVTGYTMVINGLLMLSLSGFYSSVFFLHLEIAPNYAGTLLGFTSSISELFAVMFFGVLRENSVVPLTYFLIGSTLTSLLVGIVYISTKLEPWNNHSHLLEGEDYELEYY